MLEQERLSRNAARLRPERGRRRRCGKLCDRGQQRPEMSSPPSKCGSRKPFSLKTSVTRFRLPMVEQTQEQTEGIGRTDASEDVLEVIAQPMPDGLPVQLLCSLGRPALKQGRCTRERCPRLGIVGMQAGQRDRRLARMLGAPADRGHQPGASGAEVAIGGHIEEIPQWRTSMARMFASVGQWPPAPCLAAARNASPQKCRPSGWRCIRHRTDSRTYRPRQHPPQPSFARFFQHPHQRRTRKRQQPDLRTDGCRAKQPVAGRGVDDGQDHTQLCR